MDKTKLTAREFLEANGFKCPEKIDQFDMPKGWDSMMKSKWNEALSFLDQPMPVVDRTQAIEELAKLIHKKRHKYSWSISTGLNKDSCIEAAKEFINLGYTLQPQGIVIDKDELHELLYKVNPNCSSRIRMDYVKAIITKFSQTSKKG